MQDGGGGDCWCYRLPGMCKKTTQNVFCEEHDLKELWQGSDTVLGTGKVLNLRVTNSWGMGHEGHFTETHHHVWQVWTIPVIGLHLFPKLTFNVTGCFHMEMVLIATVSAGAFALAAECPHISFPFTSSALAPHDYYFLSSATGGLFQAFNNKKLTNRLAIANCCYKVLIRSLCYFKKMLLGLHVQPACFPL